MTEELHRVIRLRDLPKVTGLKRTAIQKLMAEGEFPLPIRLSPRAVGWIEAEVAAWQRRRIAERDTGQMKPVPMHGVVKKQQASIPRYKPPVPPDAKQ